MPGSPEASDEANLDAVAERMRRDWDQRAAADAQHYVYTRDSGADEPDFEMSGRVNYNQLVRPFLPVLLNGHPAKSCRVLEIGCGVGRMTRWFAEEFLEVCGVDISEKMIEDASLRLRNYPNVALQKGSGRDLGGLPENLFDLAFSYIVFQHIPSRAVIQSYIREAARVLKPGGVLKFQLNGDRSEEDRAKAKDSWHGESFAFLDACETLYDAGFSYLASEGIMSRHFVLTARKGPPSQPGLRSYILPGEAWAAEQLLEGWTEPLHGSLRVVAPHSRALLGIPAGEALRFFAAFHLWPVEPFAARKLTVRVGDLALEPASLAQPGDHYLEIPIPRLESQRTDSIVTMEIDPGYSPSIAATVRCLGIYNLNAERPAFP